MKSLYKNDPIGGFRVIWGKDYNEALNEALGISGSCKSESYKIANIIEKDIRSNKTPIGRDMIVKEYNGKTRVTIFDSAVCIVWKYFNILLPELYDEVYETKKEPAYYDEKTNTIHITVFAKSGTIVLDTLIEDLSHEIFHNYKRFVYETPEKYYTHIEKINELLHSQKSTKEQKVVAWLLYLSMEEEQQAFCNGAYNYITKVFDDCESISSVYTETLESTKLWKNYISFRKSICDFINKISEAVYEENNLHVILGMSYKKCCKMIKEGYNRYLTNMGRMLALIREEYNLRRPWN